MPFLAPVFSTLAAAAAAGGVSGFLVRLGGSIILSALARKFTGGAGGSSMGWGNTATLNDTLIPRRIIYGSVRTAGAKIFEHSSKGKNGPASVLNMIVVVAGHEVEEIGNIYLDGHLAVKAGETTGTGRYEGYVQIERAMGTTSQRAFPDLRSDLPDLWTDDHRMRGVAGIRLRLVYDKEDGADVFPTGRPNVTINVKGKCDILDPRTGLRGYTNNAALCAADYCALPAPVGFGAAIGAEDGIVVDDLIEAANICAEEVTLADGSTQVRYTCNGVVDTGQTRQQIVRDLVGSMAGQFVPIGGTIVLRAGAYRIPAATFDLSEARGDITLTTLMEVDDNCNGVRAKFISAANDWQADDAPVIRSSTYLAEDQGVERYLDLELPFTTSEARALRIARIEMERRRRQITVEWPGMLSCWRAAADDTVGLTVPSLGWAAKPFEVDAVTLSIETDENDIPRLVPNFVLRETSPLMYDPDATALQIYAAAPRTTLPDPFDVEPGGVPVLTEELYETRTAGGVKVRLLATWSASDTGTVASYELRATGPDGKARRQAGIKDTSAELLDVQPGDWQIEVRAVSTLGVRSSWVSVKYRVHGLAAKPQALAGASIGSAGGLAILRWTQAPDLDVRIGGQIVIRHSTSTPPIWAASVTWATLPGSATLAVGELMPGGYLLRARDSSGKYGPVVVLQSDGATVLPFAPVTMLQEDDEFSGAKTGTQARGGALRLAAADGWLAMANVRAAASVIYPTGAAVTSGQYEFAAIMDLGIAKTVRLRRVVDLLTLPIVDNIWTRVGSVRDWDSFIGIGAAAGDAVIEIQTTPDDPAGSPVWSDWRIMTGEELTTRAVRARLTLTTDDIAYTPQLTALRIIADGVI